VVREKKVYKARDSMRNKGKGESKKTEGGKVYTQSIPNSNKNLDYPFGTAIAIARNMPSFNKGEDMDEGQRLEMIEEYIKKNGATKCEPGESGNDNKGLSPWSRIKLTDDSQDHPLDQRKKGSRGHKK